MRKKVTVTITDDNRDKSKIFVLTEMPASQAEKWAMRAFLGMANSGVEIPDDIAQAGLAGIAAIGIQAIGSIRYSEAEPLMDEMFACVQIMPEKSRKEVVRDLIEDDIEEISTRLKLRKELIALHTDFFKPAAPLTSPSGSTGTPATTATIKTSPGSSE